MKGVYTVKRKYGAAVYISYQPPGESYVRELVETVKRGPRTKNEVRYRWGSRFIFAVSPR